jgi:hypothetical protein
MTIPVAAAGISCFLATLNPSSVEAVSPTPKVVDQPSPEAFSGKPFQLDNGWSPFMEAPIMAKLRDPDSFIFEFATPFEKVRFQGALCWMSAIQYRLKSGSGYKRDMGIILETDGKWTFYTGDEARNLKIKKIE